MFPRLRLQKIRDLYHEYPRQFWLLIFATFIDRLGGALLFPFFTLYVTRKFQIGMTQVGVLFGLFAISAMAGGLLGGGLSDRLGRKGTLILGLVASAGSSVIMGLVDDLPTFFMVALISGIFSEAGGPARQAMIADLLPADKRTEGFGILRIVANLSVAIGPAIGGFLASRSYLLLFITDAVASTITAAIVFLILKETRPQTAEGEKPETMVATFRGYGRVLKDRLYIAFIFANILMGLVYVQMNSTLSVYLRDFHSIAEQQFGYIMSLNAAMVVLMQFSITRKIRNKAPMWMMALGCVFYAIGFGMYGFVSAYWLFLLAMAVITIGEMIISPVGQAIVTMLAPETMRGRYMAMNGFSWTISFAVGPLLAGLAIDSGNQNWVWYAAIILSIASAAAFLAMRKKAFDRTGSQEAKPAVP
ncbi:MAG: MFS transporter [Anaerolineales bacterium]|nr:MFS transporter [Anaerolineales bacterium]